MCKLFFNRVQDLISVIDSNLPKIFLDTLSKSDLEHAYIFAYALWAHNGARSWIGEVPDRDKPSREDSGASRGASTTVRRAHDERKLVKVQVLRFAASRTSKCQNSAWLDNTQSYLMASFFCSSPMRSGLKPKISPNTGWLCAPIHGAGRAALAAESDGIPGNP